MLRLFKQFWNYCASRKHHALRHRDLNLGLRVYDEQQTPTYITLPSNRRAEHIAILGKTGTGKSTLLRYLLKQDIAAGRGFVCFDFHGDMVPFLLATVAAQEKVVKKDLSSRLIIVEPADQECSVGLNPLEQQSGDERFVQIAEFAQILKQRWRLESFGARTDELLRNS